MAVGDNGHSVNSIAQLYNDSDFINDRSNEWNRNVKAVYQTIAELKSSWAGEFSKSYTDAVEKVQPDLVDFATELSKLASKLATVSNMYKALEAGMPVGAADEVDAFHFDLTDTGAASTEHEVTFDPDQCKEKASIMNEAADKIDSIISEVEESIGAINANYSSPNGTEVINKVMKMSQAAPDYVKAIKDCANCLINVVAPQYEAIESYAESA